MDKNIMKDKEPVISIIMPAFNREDLIAESIESALKQTFTDFELIVIDDGSKDKTVEVAKKYLDDPRVILIQNEKNIGIANTRNKAVKLARGKYIAMLDSDDVWLNNEKLEKQLKFLETNQNYALYGSNIIHIDTSGKHLKTAQFPLTDSSIRKTILRRNAFAQSTILCRKEAMIQAGLYSTRFAICDDYDLWLRIGRNWKFANSGEAMTGYRIHGGNITHTKRLTAAREVLEIVRMHKDNYPTPSIGLIKAYLRILLAYARS
jgi:glycosyltransferase involved in cell wall biosynthesis